MAPWRVEIVPLTARDVDACAAIMATSELWTRYRIDRAAARTLWFDALRSTAHISVARLDARAAGFAWYIPRGGFGLSGYLKLLGVDAATRGLGIGSALLAHVERATLADGSRDLVLLVSDFNLAAQRFYQRHGYARIGALPDYVIPGITELIYRKQLHVLEQ